MTLFIRELPWIEPADAFARWAGDPWVAWLDSGGPGHERARHSYLAIEPFARLTSVRDVVTLDDAPVAGDALAAMDAALRRWRLPGETAPVPFIGGAVGFFGYDLASRLEATPSRVPIRHPDVLGTADMAFGFYDVVLAFDVAERRAWLLSSGLPADLPDRPSRARRRAEAILERLGTPAAPIEAAIPPIAWRCEIPRPDYEARVARVIDYIRAGDIYQANFTGRHLAPRPPGLSAPAIFQALRAASPAPFAAYLGCGEGLALASASPERFIHLDAAGRIETRPIKGTRPRGRTPEEDTRLARDLTDSIKDQAENLMIVDLMRNDIGRVAVVGSVAVDVLYQLESFASVHHLVSSVTAQLRPGLGAVDLLRASLPGGSITGAPKIRAMQIIDELEVARRGPYCGAIGWLGFDGAMDTSIAIRTMTITQGWLVAQAGGGIVADSDPAEEFDEMMVKIGPLLLGRS